MFVSSTVSEHLPRGRREQIQNVLQLSQLWNWVTIICNHNIKSIQISTHMISIGLVLCEIVNESKEFGEKTLL